MHRYYYFYIAFSVLLFLSVCSCTTETKHVNLRDHSSEFQQTITLADSLEQEGLLDSSLHLLEGLSALVDTVGTIQDQAYIAGLLGRHYLYRRGKINQAQEYLIKNRDILERHTNQETPELIRNYLDLSFLHVKKLELSFARSYAMMALDFAKTPPLVDSVLLAEANIALGHVYFFLLKHQVSEQYYHRAYTYLPADDMDSELTRRILIGLINNFNNAKNIDSATFYLSTYYDQYAGEPDAMAEFHRLYGICHYITGQYEASAEHLEKAVVLFRQDNTPDPYTHPDAFLVLSAANQKDHNFLPALASVDSAMVRKFGNTNDMTTFSDDIYSVSLLASRAEILGDQSIAEMDTQIALEALRLYETIDTLRQNFVKLDPDTYLHQQFYDNYYYAKPIEIYAFLFQETKKMTWLGRMHDVITAYKAQGFYRDKLLNQLYHSPAKEKQSFQDFIQNDVALEEAIHANNTYLINMLLRQRQIIVQQVSQDIPEVINQLINPSNISSDEILKYTREHHVAVINYYIGNTYYNEDRIYVLIAANGQFKLQVLKQSLDILSLNEDLYNLNTVAASSSSTLDTAIYYSTSHDLYEALLKGTTSRLDDANDLVIISDQRLHLLSFEGLVTNDPESYASDKDIVEHAHYLIEDFNITYAYSPNDLMPNNTSTRLDFPLQLLAMAFSSRETLGSAKGSDSIQELNSSYRELQILEQLHGAQDVKYFYGYDCTKQNFLKYASDAEIIHISTHGAYDPEDRTSSVLYLRNKNGIEKLYPHEIRYRDIQPRLLILSACDSGAGKASNEEGMFSIGRTFQAFGAQQVISALWPLSGNASAEFCQIFYTELSNGNSIEGSTRIAKMQLLRKSKRFALPGYWSTWILHQ